MKAEDLCMGCMANKGETVICTQCGYDEDKRRSPLVLPHRTILNMQFLLGKVLGKPGGFGITYLGWDLRLETMVAIKEYLPRDLAGRDTDRASIAPHSEEDEKMFDFGLEQFIKEARTLAKFDHANIMRVRTFFEENGTAYLVMDYYDGMSLSEYLKEKQGEMSWELAAETMMPILDGLREVHEKGFLHRDIKPQNIYLTKDGRPILLDFGAARFAMGERSRSLSAVLTPGYSPYEQYHRRGKQGAWTDIYACGATLYKMITGISPPEAIEREKTDELILIEKKVKEIPKHVSDAIIKAMATEPEDRFQDIRRFQQALLAERVELEPATPPMPLSPSSIPEPESSPATKTEKKQQTGKKLIAIMAAVLILVSIFLFFSGPKESEDKESVTSASFQTEIPPEPTEKKLEKIPAKKVVPFKKKAAIQVESKPSGADIFINGQFKGTAPLKISDIKPGNYPVKASLFGYIPDEKTVVVNEGKKAVVTFYLDAEKIQAKVFVTTNPKNCMIQLSNMNDPFFNGIKLKEGRYQLEVSKQGYKTKTQWVDITSSRPIDFYVKLEKLPGLSGKGYPGQIETDPITGMEFVWVPKVCFQMGQTEAEKQYLLKEVGEKKYKKLFERELPRHEICNDGFWMAKTEVTRGQFKQFIKETAYRTDAEEEGSAWVFDKDADFPWIELPGFNWEITGFSQDDSHPVVCVSWNDVREFIKWLNNKSGRKFVLPTEAQWEYAARGGTDFMRFWGANDAEACKYANVADKDNWITSFPCSDGYEYTSPVGKYKPNPFGLYDMLGNVWEWCEDVYDKNAYSKHDRNNPVVTAGSFYRVFRGGSWNNNSGIVRAARRGRGYANYRDSGVGFRLCLSVRQ
jgi:formylglycine-generating enzyme required for sulfatase activity/serine/threonine protein kinase